MKSPQWLTLLALVALQANATPPASRPSAGAASRDRPALRCFIEPSTGSHIKKRVCMTETEYAARKAADQEAMMKLKAGGGAERTKSSLR